MSDRAQLQSIASSIVLLSLLTACIGNSPYPVVPAPADSARTLLRDGLVAALQVEGKRAAATLRRVRAEDLDSTRAALLTCTLARLDGHTLPPVTVADPFVGQVLNAYRGYWTSALRGERTADKNERKLLTTLNALIESSGGPVAPSMDSIEVILKPILRARGYHPLLGVTSPLRELMLWQGETERRYDVQLPEGLQPVTVVFLDRFASLGWAGFATCDRYHTGGWTKPDRLYAVASAYDTTSENFRISYLAHEGQHFWDAQHLALDTPGHRLEYRAKLVELAVGQASVYDLLAGFAANTSADSTIPHSYANGRVVAAIAAKLFPASTTPPHWRDASIAEVNASAAELLRDDNSPSRP